eukprot:TRINITY_DN10238_c0_g1_i3.p2 TRINITY_DN10238_c0_g1~~TRINITY_DN10238_c0_g1_i3.p2  ORF type:complete len:118 (-),score=47.57 TRINITY_DN10238_c0_g1_i3:48-401(-)
MMCGFCFFFFSSRRRHTRCREVSWARRCVQETGYQRRVHGAQILSSTASSKISPINWSSVLEIALNQNAQLANTSFIPVSYTHLTLPTILLVQISVVAVSLKKKRYNNAGDKYEYRN